MDVNFPDTVFVGEGSSQIPVTVEGLKDGDDAEKDANEFAALNQQLAKPNFDKLMDYSRSVYEEGYVKLGAVPFLAQQLNAIEVVTELFGGVPPARGGRGILVALPFPRGLSRFTRGRRRPRCRNLLPGIAIYSG